MRLPSSLLLSTVLLGVALLAPASAAAADWSGSFPDGEISAALPRDGLVLILLSPEGPNAAEPWLSAALANSSRVRSLVGASQVDDVTGLSDEQILARLAKTPVDVIGVLRLDESGDEPTATAVFYTPQGARLGSLTVTPRTAARVQVSEKPLERVQTSDDQMSRLERYRASTIVTQQVTTYDPSIEQHYDEWTQSYLGVQREELKPAQVYERIGRQDLARRYRRRAFAKPTLGLAGIGLMCGGGAVAGLFGTQALGSGDTQDWILAGAGAGGVLAGWGLVGWSHSMVRHPVDYAEHQRLTNAYNAALAQEYGLSGDGGADAGGVELDLAGWAAPGTAGVGVMGRF